MIQVPFTQSMAKLLPAFVPSGKATRKRKEIGFAKLFGAPPSAILVQLIHDDPGEKGSVIRFSWQSSLPVFDLCSTTICFKENMEARAIEKFDAITHADAAKVVAKVETEHLEAFGKIAADPGSYDTDDEDEDDPRPAVPPKHGDPRAYRGGPGYPGDD